MKFKKLCTIMSLITTLSLVGCDKKEEIETVVSPQSTEVSENIETTNSSLEEEKVDIAVDNGETDKVTTTTNDDKSETQTENTSKEANEEVTNSKGYKENEYFYRIYGLYKEDLDEIINKNSSSSNIDTIHIYDHNSADDPDNFFEIDSINISKELTLKEKLTLLCSKMEEAYKTESGNEIAIEIEDCIGDDVAVVSIVEKYPMHNYEDRKTRLKYTLNQPKKDGVDWFNSVVVVYDSGAQQ